jgi:hypothetical protein
MPSRNKSGDEGTGPRNQSTRARPDALTGLKSGVENDQSQTPCSPVSIAITSARKQIPQNNTMGSSVLSDFSDEDVDADMGAKM